MKKQKQTDYFDVAMWLMGRGRNPDDMPPPLDGSDCPRCKGGDGLLCEDCMDVIDDMEADCVDWS